MVRLVSQKASRFKIRAMQQEFLPVRINVHKCTMNFRALSRSGSGFTLVELVATIMVLGIMAIVALPRFASVADYDEATYRDTVLSILSLSRQRALASRRFVCVNVSAGTGANAGIALALDARAPESIPSGPLSCTVSLPVTGYPECNTGIACPKSATVGAASFAFDPQGRPVDITTRSVLSSAVSIAISNQQAVTIQPRSGYAS